MTMSLLSRCIDFAASVFCRHEWASRHEPHRWYLECVRCGSTSAGIEVGRRAPARAAIEPLPRRASPVVRAFRPSSTRAA